MKQSSRQFDDLFPLMGIRDGVVISKRGDITIGWELTLPDAFSLLESDYNELTGVFASAIRTLPPWTMVHRQDVYLYEPYRAKESNSFLSLSYEKHFEGRRFLTHRQYVFLTLSSKASALRPVSASGLFGGRSISKLPGRECFEALSSKGSEFISVLTGAGKIQARALKDEDYVTLSNDGIIPDYLSLGQRDHIFSDFQMGPDHVQVLDNTIWAYTISEADDLPTEVPTSQKVESLSGAASELYLSYGSPFGLLMDTEHIVNQYILTAPQSEVLSELDSRKRRMQSMSKSNDNRLGAEEIDAFVDEVHKESLCCVRAHTNILAWGHESDHLAIRGKVSSALAVMGVTCVESSCDTPVLWYAGIPGAACEIGAENLMLMELCSAICLGGFESFEKDVPKGKLKICDRLRNVPVTIDVQTAAQDAGLIDNYNAFVLGGSGTGKSFFTNFFVRSCYDQGETVFIIDVGDSYEGLCSVIREESGGRDGIYYSWDAAHPITFNAFIGFNEWVDERGKLRQDCNGLNFLLSFLQTLWVPAGGWTSEKGTILKEMIREFILSRTDLSELPIFDDLRSFIRDVIAPQMYSEEGYTCGDIIVGCDRFDVNAFLLAMKDYAKGGAFDFLLNDPAPKDLFSSRFTVFEVDKLSSLNDAKFYSLCVLCIMNSFDAKMRTGPGFKVMVIEEAWKAISNETMAPYLAGLWKTARKFMTSAVVVTQQVSDIMSSGVIRDSILQNSSVRILLDQSNNQNNFSQLSDLLGLTVRQRNLILSMNRANNPLYRYREVFIALGEKKAGVYATEVSPQEAVAFESNKQKKQPFLTLSSEVGPVEAIRKLTGGSNR